MSDETADPADHTILAIQMDKSLRQRIKAAANMEHRTESSFARFYLEKAADSVTSETSTTECDA